MFVFFQKIRSFIKRVGVDYLIVMWSSQYVIYPVICTSYHDDKTVTHMKDNEQVLFISL